MKRDNEFKTAYIMVSPTIVVFSIFIFFALAYVVYMSFFSFAFTYDGSIDKSFIGFQNYYNLFHDKVLWKSVVNTLIYTAIVVPTQIIISLFLANLLNKKLKLTPVFRVLFFLPMISATTSVMMIFMFVFGIQGPFNQFLINHQIITEPVNWFRSSQYSIYFIALSAIWQAIPFSTVIFSAALADVNQSLYEAADIDGASEMRKFFKITMPEILPTVIFIIVIGVVGSLQMFDQAMIVQAPDNASSSIAYMIYEYAFDPSYNSMGYAAAISVLLGIVIYTITYSIRRFDRKD